MDEFQSEDNLDSKDVLGAARIVRPSDPDTYLDPDSARVRARQLGCIGIRRYNNRNGGVSWMPCTNESDYRKYSGIGYSGRKFRRTQLEREVRKIVGGPSKRKFHEKSANYTNPELRERIKNRIMAGSRGGAPGQWSARKAQLLALEYRRAGGGYSGKRSKKQRSLVRWTKQRWRTSDGKPAKRGNVTRRYLPAKAWEKLTPGQRAATNRKKIAGSKLGRQFVPNTEAAASARKRATRGTKHADFYDAYETKVDKRRIGGRLGGNLGTQIGRGEVENSGRSARRALGRIGAIVEPFDPHARDADSDGIVQEGTIHERPAIPGVNPIGPAPRPGKIEQTVEGRISRAIDKAKERRAARALETDAERATRETAESEARRIRTETERVIDDVVREDAKKRKIRANAPEKETPKVVRQAPRLSPRREREKPEIRKPINLPKGPTTDEILDEFEKRPPSEARTLPYVPGTPSEPVLYQEVANIPPDRVQELQESRFDLSNSLTRPEKSKVWHAWENGEYSIDELADHFDAVRDEVAQVIKNHQKFREENLKKFRENNENLAKAIDTKFGVSKDATLESVREGYVKNWDSLLQWAFRNPDSRKKNKNNEIESALFRAFPDGAPPKGTQGTYVMGVRPTKRNNKQQYVRDIAQIDNKPQSFRQLDELARATDSALGATDTRWSANERAATARMYREIARNRDVEKMWDSSITGAMAAGPNMTPQEEAEWKHREWKRQELKRLALTPNINSTLPTLAKELKTGEIARDINGLDLLADNAVDQLYDKTVEEMLAAGMRPRGYRSQAAPLAPRELATLANAKRPLVKEFLDEYRLIKPDGNIARLDIDTMSDGDVEDFFNTFIMPGLINAGNPTAQDVRNSVRDTTNADALSLAEEVLFGIGDEYQDLALRTKIIKQRLKDAGLDENNPNFDAIVAKLIDETNEKAFNDAMAEMYATLKNPPRWMMRSPEDFINDETGLPYAKDEWERDATKNAMRFLEITDDYLDGNPVDPLEAESVKDELNRQIDIGHANGWLDYEIPEAAYPEYMNRARRRADEDGNGPDGGNGPEDGFPLNMDVPDDNLPSGPEEPEEPRRRNEMQELLENAVTYGHQFGPEKGELPPPPPSFEDEYGPLDTDEVWNTPILDDNGNPLPYDGSPTHPLNLDLNGNPLDVTQHELLPAVLFRHWLSNGHFLKEWTEENYPGSQVARYKILDEMTNLAVTPLELEDALYKGDINSKDPLAIDENFLAGLDSLIKVIQADNPEWFQSGPNNELIGDINALIRPGNYASGGVPRVTLRGEDYSATQSRRRMNEARDAAIKAERDLLLGKSAASKQRRADLWKRLEQDGLTPEEIAFEENLLDTTAISKALQKYAVENSIPDAQYHKLQNIANSSFANRADAFTAKRIQKIKDEFTAAGLEPKAWADAIDAEIARQERIVANIDVEYRRFRSAFSRQMILVRAIFETRPPNRKQRTLADGTIVPGWDPQKESAARYLNRIRRWDLLHLGTPDKPGPLTELLAGMERSSIEDGRDGASGATARIMTLAKQNIDALREARREYTRIKQQADQSGISGFMRTQSRNAELFDTARENTRSAARRAAYGNFTFLEPRVMRRYDKAGLPISRSVRNSAAGFNKRFAEEIKDVTSGELTPIEKAPGFNYLSPKLQTAARAIESFSNRAQQVSIDMRRGKRNAQVAKNIITPEVLEKIDTNRARIRQTRISRFQPNKLSPDAVPVFGSGISGAMRIWIQQGAYGRWYPVDYLGNNKYTPGFKTREEAEKYARTWLVKNPEPFSWQTDGTIRKVSAYGISARNYIGDIVNDADIIAASSQSIINNKNPQKAEIGDAVILRTNKVTGKREILLVRRQSGPYSWSNGQSLSLPSGAKLDTEQLRDTPRRHAMSEFHLKDSDIIKSVNLGTINDRYWDPTNPRGVSVSGTHIELSPDTNIDFSEPGINADWYQIEDIALGKYPLAFGQAAWLSSIFSDEEDYDNFEKFSTLNELSWRRQEKIIDAVNRNRKNFLGGKNRLMFPKQKDDLKRGFSPEGPDADARIREIIKKTKDQIKKHKDGGISGAMGARYIKGPITQWGSDELTDAERRKILDDVIELRNKDANTIWIMHQLNAKWVDDNFRRVDGSYHQFNQNQVKDVIYKARIDGVQFPKLWGSAELNPIGPDEHAAIATINNMSVAGHSLADIADELDVSEIEVAKVQRALGLVRIHREKALSKQSSEIVRMFGDGKTMPEIAKHFGITERVARKRYKDALSTGSITGMMSADGSEFSSRAILRREMEKVREQNKDAFFMRTYQRMSDSEIAAKLGIAIDEVGHAVNNHMKSIDANETRIVNDVRKQFKELRNTLLAAEKQHIQMRLDGLSLQDIASHQGITLGAARMQELNALARLNLNSEGLAERRRAVQRLLDAPIDSGDFGIGKRIAFTRSIPSGNDPHVIEAIAAALNISPYDANRLANDYLRELYKSESPQAKELRRIALTQGGKKFYDRRDKLILSDNDRAFLHERLLGMSTSDYQKRFSNLSGSLVGVSNAEDYIRARQASLMNRINIAGLIGTSAVRPITEEELKHYRKILGGDIIRNVTSLGAHYAGSDDWFENAYSALTFYHPDAKRGDRNAIAKMHEIMEAELGLTTGYTFRYPSFMIYNGSDNIADDYRIGSPFSHLDSVLPGGRDLISDSVTGKMSTGAKSSIEQKREDRESRIERATSALDRMRVDSPEKYQSLKKSALDFYRASTGMNIDADNVIDDINEIPHSLATRQARGANIARESEITRQVKQHALTKRLMAELMVDFAVDGQGNLKGKPSDHVSDEKNIARRGFTKNLNTHAKQLIEDNNLLKVKPRQFVVKPDSEEEKQFQATLRKLVKRGLTQDEMAVELGIGRWPIQQQLRKMKLTTMKRGDKPHPLDDRISELLADGMSDRAIGREIGMSYQFVGDRRRKLLSRKLAEKTSPSKIVGQMQSGGITGAMAGKPMPRNQYSEHDFYGYLDLKPGATAAEVKAAYKEIAKKFHPDKNPGDKKAEERMKLANSAFEVLKDPVEKEWYDKNIVPNLGRTARNATNPPKPPTPNRPSGGTGFTPKEPPKKEPLPPLKNTLEKRLGIKIPLKDNIVPNGSTLYRYTRNSKDGTVRVRAPQGGHVNLDENRFWDVHHAIADAISKFVTKKRAPGEPKKYFIIGGPPAAGKSTLRFDNKFNIPSPNEAAHVDADEIKEMIPDAKIAHHFNDPAWANHVHDESKMITQTALSIAQERNLDIVSDSMGQFIEGLDNLRKAKADGYEIISHYVVAPKDILKKRLADRQKTDARRMPEHIIDAAMYNLQNAMPQVADLSDEFSLYDGSSGTPKLIAHKAKGGELKILNPIAYDYGDFEKIVKNDANFERPSTAKRNSTVAKNHKDAQMIRDFDSGSSVSELADKYKTSKRRVYDTVRRYSVDESRSDAEEGFGFTRGRTSAEDKTQTKRPFWDTSEPQRYRYIFNHLTDNGLPKPDSPPSFSPPNFSSPEKRAKFDSLLPKLADVHPEDYDVLRQLAGQNAYENGKMFPDGMNLDYSKVQNAMKELKEDLITMGGWNHKDFDALGDLAEQLNFILDVRGEHSNINGENLGTGFINEMADLIRKHGGPVYAYNPTMEELLDAMWRYKIPFGGVHDLMYYAREQAHGG